MVMVNTPQSQLRGDVCPSVSQGLKHYERQHVVKVMKASIRPGDVVVVADVDVVVSAA